MIIAVGRGTALHYKYAHMDDEDYTLTMLVENVLTERVPNDQETGRHDSQRLTVKRKK
jgi:hypothetical protein